MRSAKVRISFGALPPRSKPLSAADMAAVFGGCAERWEACQDCDDCCPNMSCGPISGKCNLTYA
jgi:hypothetical protein